MRHSQGGFTLVELLVTIAITTVVTGALTEALIIGLRTTDSTNETLAETADAELVTTYLATDVQSARLVDKTALDESCGGSVAGVTQVLRLGWADNGVDQLVSYAYRAEPSSQPPTRQLVRRHCTVSALGTTLEDEQVLARSLSASTATTVSCAPASACSPLPLVVTLTLTEHSGTVYQLTAATRSK
jgi:prepilin-type N-terminal cleavage/methylation domain-containing protein